MLSDWFTLSQICSESFIAVALKTIEQFKEQKASNNRLKNWPRVGNRKLVGAENSAHRQERVKDTFKTSNFNEEVQKDLNDTFYFFHKANLKWHLMKRQAQFMGFPVRRFKRDSGTRWVEHQVIATSVYLNNLPVTAGFFNHQITSPYNASMKSAVPKMEGFEKSMC